MTGVSECSQQRGNLKDNGYRYLHAVLTFIQFPLNQYFYCPDAVLGRVRIYLK
ncbi:hypothetical protein [Photorhabdus sp. MH8.4]